MLPVILGISDYPDSGDFGLYIRPFHLGPNLTGRGAEVGKEGGGFRLSLPTLWKTYKLCVHFA